MRPIPQTLKQKIEKANQTLYENANPQMDVLLRRARSGLTSTDLFYVQTIREGDDLEALGIDLQRTDVNAAPSKAFNIYIKGGICKVATKNMPSKVKEQWLDVLTIGAATDCDIAFDGRWYKDSKYRWQLVTIGNPWLFYVTAGNLYAKQWTADPVLLAEGVNKIAALRGWKNTYIWNHDQGIIVCYLKNNAVYYRNYCQQPPDQPALWEIERQVDLPAPAQNVALFRTNDYRTGFLCESEGQMYMTLTEREWANMAIPPEFLTASPASVKVEIFDIQYKNAYEVEQITAQPAVETDLGYVLTDNKFIEIYNQPVDGDWGKELVFMIENNIYNIYTGDFEIVDSFNRRYVPNEIERINAQTYKLKFLDLNNFNNVDKIGTLKFKGTATTNKIGLLYEPFEKVFYPQNLVPTAIPLPEVEVIWNE
jgi:hypothetical protein